MTRAKTAKTAKTQSAKRTGKAVATGTPVLVTTAHRGVFFGYYDGDASVPVSEITLRQARLCVMWTTDMRGVLGLATVGPSAECRVGPAVVLLTLTGVTAVAMCTVAAARAWEAAPWGR